MVDDYNPFQSPLASPPTRYPVPQNLYTGPMAALYASGRTRAIVAMLLLGFVAVYNSACGAMYVRQYDVFNRVQQGEHFDRAKLVADDQQLSLSEKLRPIWFVAAAIAFLFWVHRACRNLPALGDPESPTTPAWAVGSYFVPIANLFIPCAIMAEIWRCSDPAQLGIARKSASPLVVLWWCVFLGRIIPFLGARLQVIRLPYRPSIDLRKEITAWAIAYYVMEVVAAILAIAVVYCVDKNQTATHDLIAAQPRSEPTTGVSYG